MKESIQTQIDQALEAQPLSTVLELAFLGIKAEGIEQFVPGYKTMSEDDQREVREKIWRTLQTYSW